MHLWRSNTREVSYAEEIAIQNILEGDFMHYMNIFPSIPQWLHPSFITLTLLHSSHELHLKESIFGNFNKLYLIRLYEHVVTTWSYGMWSQEVNRIPVELFQILKDDAVKVLHSVCQGIWKSQQYSQDRKRSIFIPNPKKSNAKECSNYNTIAFISHASKVMLKILQQSVREPWTSWCSSWI